MTGDIRGTPGFGVQPLAYLRGVPEPAQALRRYFDRYSGSWFEHLADDRNPDQFTASDIVAVSMLGVDIPPHVAIWILEHGKDQCSQLLCEIPNDVDIWDASLVVFADGGAASILWNLLQEGKWPHNTPQNGLGAVMAGKLLAAKRPRLIPIYDRLVGQALHAPSGQFWFSMWSAFQDPELPIVLKTIRTKSDPPRELSILRTLDIVVWLTEHENATESVRVVVDP